MIARISLLTLFSCAAFQGCAVSPAKPASPVYDHSFTVYWPPGNSKQVRVAVKDAIDMKGVVTSSGSQYLAKHSAPAARDAECLRGARERKVLFVGKTNLTEFALGTTGMNDYFGTPRNYLNPKTRLIPGGSSSGSAVAVANGHADIAFGTDTAGSIRVPAACCGILGLKTTLHLISLKGVSPISPDHLDTVGPMARDIPHLVEGMDLLKPGFAAQYRETVSASRSPRNIRIGRLYIPGTDPAVDQAIDEALAARGFQVVKLDQRFVEQWAEAKKYGRAIALADGYRNLQQYLTEPGVTAPTKATILLGRVEEGSYADDLAALARWQRELRRVFRRVDFIALPTLRTLPPRVPHFVRIALFEQQVFDLQNTMAVNFAGNPALAIPVPIQNQQVPVTSLQLVGPKLSEAKLINVARMIDGKHETARIARSAGR